MNRLICINFQRKVLLYYKALSQFNPANPYDIIERFLILPTKLQKFLDANGYGFAELFSKMRNKRP